jgi:hypothetical protein
MKNSIPALVASCALLLAGCGVATNPRVDPGLSPERVVLSLSDSKFTARSDPDVVFGLAALKAHLRSLEVRCQNDTGQVLVTRRREVHFIDRDPSHGGREARLFLPADLSCKTSSTNLWGASISYGNPRYFSSSWADAVFYYAELRVDYVGAAQLERTDPYSESNKEAARKASAECSARAQEYNARLRSRPEVGMQVAFGVIVELRPPLALVQYDAFGRQMKGQTQEWLQISTLSAGSSCPR